MRWVHLFSNVIRNRGFLYFKNGHVKKVQKTGNTYTGTVTGSGLDLKSPASTAWDYIILQG